jgi:phosphoribosyl 1,2-cyclic phosphodiesterase
MIGFCPLASGSKGNCIYLGTKHTKILIDAGLSAKSVKERLSEIHVDLNDIDAILVTHEHTDHISGLQTLGCKMKIPIFSNSDTAKGICGILKNSPKFKIFSTGEIFEFADLEIYPFSIQHDAFDPVAFTIKCGNIKLGFCTDLGFATTLVIDALQGCDYLYVEANHEPSMVFASARPLVYKQRVLSRQGHLSNGDCAELLTSTFHSGLKHVHLAHLSRECNAEELALKIIREKLNSKGYAVDVSIAYQDKLSQVIYF